MYEEDGDMIAVVRWLVGVGRCWVGMARVINIQLNSGEKYKDVGQSIQSCLRKIIKRFADEKGTNEPPKIHQQKCEEVNKEKRVRKYPK